MLNRKSLVLCAILLASVTASAGGVTGGGGGDDMTEYFLTKNGTLTSDGDQAGENILFPIAVKNNLAIEVCEELGIGADEDIPSDKVSQFLSLVQSNNP